jgi:hypothetical protein
MPWPLSSNFAKLISNTADRGEARYTLPGVGLLTPGREYYWHVRAKDAQGVWGPWSATWTFTPGGPGQPVNVSLECPAGQGVGVLRWKPNPVGGLRIKYRVNGSDEKGLVVSDEPYEVNVGRSKDLPTRFSANFVAETPHTELEVLGLRTELTVPNANKAFYRVVAIEKSQINAIKTAF